MPIVVADPNRTAHVNAIVAAQSTFFASLGRDALITPERVRRFLREPRVVAFLDTDRDAYCALRLGATYVNDGALRVKVEALFPRGAARNMLVHVLKAALQRLRQRFPEAETAEVWAEFPLAVDSQGRPDGGREQCLAWAETFVGAEAVLHDGRWIIRWRLDLASEVST